MPLLAVLQEELQRKLQYVRVLPGKRAEVGQGRRGTLPFITVH